MRYFVTAAIILGTVLPLSVEAQTTRLPRKSASERQVEEINRNIQLDRRFQSLEQDIQSQSNQLRQDINRQKLFSSQPSTAPFRNCPPGAIC